MGLVHWVAAALAAGCKSQPVAWGSPLVDIPENTPASAAGRVCHPRVLLLQVVAAVGSADRALAALLRRDIPDGENRAGKNRPDMPEERNTAMGLLAAAAAEVAARVLLWAVAPPTQE
jgi:hypothetical protein